MTQCVRIARASMFAALLWLAWAGKLYAQDPAGGQDVNSLSKASQNPVGDLVSLPFQFNFNSGGAFEDRAFFNLNFQPVMPITVTPRVNSRDESVHLPMVRQLQLWTRLGAVVGADHHGQLGRRRRTAVDGSARYRHLEDDRVQRPSHVARRAVLLQRHTTRRCRGDADPLHRLAALPRREEVTTEADPHPARHGRGRLPLLVR